MRRNQLLLQCFNLRAINFIHIAVIAAGLDNI